MISENPEKKVDELDADNEAVPLCTPNVVTGPDARQAEVIAAIKGNKKVEDLKKANGLLVNIFKKELTISAAKDAFEVALGEKNFNDKLRDDLIGMMLRDVSDIADAATSPEWSRENELVARWTEELKVSYGEQVKPGELKLVMAAIYDRAAGLVSKMGYKNKAITESAKCFEGVTVYDKETGAEKKEEFKVFKSEPMKVFTDKWPTNLSESHPEYAPAEYWVIVTTDDPDQVAYANHQKVYVGINEGDALLQKQHNHNSGWYDASRNAVSTSETKKDIEGAHKKVMDDGKKGKFDLSR